MPEHSGRQLMIKWRENAAAESADHHIVEKRGWQLIADNKLNEPIFDKLERSLDTSGGEVTFIK
jgi:hypothetical protein